ncbi:MAG TPA: AAA family ATPase [Pirellulaceae bacterium]|nr:AAA family ATPase [Pirellulaceae bacterium]
MYESFFRFTSRPFVAAPLVSSYFASESCELARQTLTRSIDRAEGPGLIIGPTGVGKTLLCRVLAARFQQTFQVAMLSSARVLTRKSLLQNILFELKLPYRNMEEGELRLALLDHLQPNEDCPNGILLIVDEAHSLSLRLLDEVRMITNLVRDGQPRVRLVLAGSSKLEEKFASPKLESFNQRIAARCYLEPFGRDDTVDYVLCRLAAAGGNADAIFDDGALRAVYQATDGIPRLINQVCDHALVMAFAGGRRQIDAAGIEEAWADLQQLPGPWNDTGAVEKAETTIEFGELDAEPAVLGTGGETHEESSDLLTDGLSAALERMSEALQCGEPVGEVTPPPVLVQPQHSFADPFGDGFDEEEMVINQAVIQSAEIFANRTRVASREGRELVASLLPEIEASTELESEPHAEKASVVCVTIKRDDEAATVVPAASARTAPTAGNDVPAAPQADWLSRVEFGAQMFEYTAFEPNSAANLVLEALCDVNIALGDLESEFDTPEQPTFQLADHFAVESADDNDDDRAIIVVQNDEPTPSSPTPEGSVHRVEYQTLFSQLRHG